MTRGNSPLSTLRGPVNIGGVTIGPGHPVYAIAEIGSNHDGSLDRAFDLIRHAADAGADAAKFQLYRADKLYPGTVTPGAIPDGWLPELKACCHEAGIEFICSVFCRETLEAYLAVEPAAVKIASPEATNPVLLTAADTTGLPLLVSTGAMTTAQTFLLHSRIWRSPHVLLHCVSAYPAPLDELNLSVIGYMAEHFHCPVGFSDHTMNTALVPSLAVAAGACVLEKHLTDSRLGVGADHPFALEPDEFAEMVAAVRDTELMLGDGVKRPTASEDPTDRRQAA